MIGEKKARALRNVKDESVRFPDYVTVSHAVCAADGSGCGWSGILLEAAFEVDGAAHNSGTGDRVVPAVTNQICPNCGATLFRTVRRNFPQR